LGAVGCPGENIGNASQLDERLVIMGYGLELMVTPNAANAQPEVSYFS